MGSLAIRRCAIGCVLAMALANHAAAAAEPPRIDPAQLVALKEIAEGYFHNRESFPFFSCRLVLRQGNAKTWAEGIERGPTQGDEELAGEWVVDGQHVLYHRRPSGEYQIRGFQGGLMVGIPPRIFVRDGSLVLSMDGILGGGAILPAGEGSPDIDMTSWNALGMITEDESWTLGPLIRRALDKSARIVLKGEAMVRGVRTLRFDVEFEAAPRNVCDVFFVDPQRGYLPIESWWGEVASRPGEPCRVERKVFITDIRRCSQDRWFPARCVGAWVGAQGEPYTVREFRVVALDADRRPDAEALTVVLPARMQLHGGARLPADITLDAGTRVSPGNLRELYAALRRRAEGEGREVPPGGAGWVRIVLFGATLAGGAILLIIAARRVRRARAATSQPGHSGSGHQPEG